MSERDKSPRRGMCAAILVLEAIVLGLTSAVMIAVEGVRPVVALPIALGLCLGCILVAGMLKRPWGYTAGWVLQAAAIALGFVTTVMFFLGGLFAFLWATAYFLGKRIEADRAAAFAAWDAQQAE